MKAALPTFYHNIMRINSIPTINVCLPLHPSKTPFHRCLRVKEVFQKAFVFSVPIYQAIQSKSSC